MSEENNAVEKTQPVETAPVAPVSEPVAPVEGSPPAHQAEETPVTEPAPATEAEAEDNAEPADDDKSEDDSPDWFMKDKYATVEDQAKAYPELMKKVGKNWGAPDGDYSLEGLEGVDKDDPLVANLAPALKELGLSQDGFTDLVKHYQQANTKMVEKFEAELKEVLTGKDAATYNAINSWMKDALKPDEIEQIRNNWLMTPNDFKLFNSLRLMIGPSTNVPNGIDGSGPRFETSRAVENDKIKYRKEIKEKIRVPDKNYENELAQRYRDALTREERAKG